MLYTWGGAFSWCEPADVRGTEGATGMSDPQSTGLSSSTDNLRHSGSGLTGNGRSQVGAAELFLEGCCAGVLLERGLHAWHAC